MVLHGKNRENCKYHWGKSNIYFGFAYCSCRELDVDNKRGKVQFLPFIDKRDDIIILYICIICINEILLYLQTMLRMWQSYDKFVSSRYFCLQ